MIHQEAATNFHGERVILPNTAVDYLNGDSRAGTSMSCT